MDSLSNTEKQSLQALAGLMIPASESYNVPGADDPVIFEDIMRSLGRDMAAAQKVASLLDADGTGTFVRMSEEGRWSRFEYMRYNDATSILVFGRVVLQCYYRDERVMRSLGMEVRAPFPKGYVVEQGDWSLLDPVKKLPKIFREVDA